MSTPLAFDPAARTELQRALAALDLAETAPRPLAMTQALLRVARCYRAAGALRAAELGLRQALRWAHAGAGGDLLVDVLCECAETAAALGAASASSADAGGDDMPSAAAAAESRRAARERARDHAFEVAARAGGVSDPRWEVQVLLRASDVLEQCGDHDDAGHLKLRAFRRCTGSVDAQADASRLPGTGRGVDA